MRSIELVRASGYLLILLPPALLAGGLAIGTPSLAACVLIVVMPFLRVLFGDSPDEQPEWGEKVASVLECLPIMAAAAFMISIAYSVWSLASSQWSISNLVGFVLSLWATCIFASCVAHELVHRQSKPSRIVGRLLSGALGYPLLEHEHRAHHAKGGDVANAEWPGVDETVWHFAARRALRVTQTAWEGDVLAAARRGGRLSGGLPLSVAATALTAVAFGVAGGPIGITMYAVVMLAVGWTMQAITYIQHWGLGDDNMPNATTGDYGWEDRCQLQAWLTLSISYHQSHHHANTVPYYRQKPMAGAPCQPAGYVILLFASMVPRVWRALMQPALARWLKRTPDAQCSAGRRLLCLSRKA